MRIGKVGAPTIVLALLCAMYFLYFVDRVSISTAAPLIKADLKISNTQLGLAFSAFAIPYALFQLIGGWIGDRLGSAADSGDLLRDRGDIDGADGRGHRNRVADSCCGWRWDSAKAPASPRPRAPWPVGRRKAIGDSRKESCTRSRGSAMR